MRTVHTLLLTAVAMMAAPAIALADRDATDQERVAIENALKQQGFEVTDDTDMELEDDAWEVENVSSNDGKEYDLKMNPQDLSITEREEED